MKPFILNRHGRMIFPSSYFPEMDFSVYETLTQFTEVVQRDFEEKAPTGTSILERTEAQKYSNRFDLLRDVALYLFWVNRYSITLYDKRLTRWRDVPRRREDVFIPVVTPWADAERKINAVATCFGELPPGWDEAAEARIFELVFDVLRHKRHHATELTPLKPTVAEFIDNTENKTFVMSSHDPDYPVFTESDILDYEHPVPELEALGRWARVLHNQYPWERADIKLVSADAIGADDFVVAFHPRSRDVMSFITRVQKPQGLSRSHRAPPVKAYAPVRPYPPIDVRRQFRVQPRVASLAVVKGEHACTNEDVIRNSAFIWSPMTAAQISAKTGIDQRLYTELSLEQIALQAAEAAVEKAGVAAEEIGAVIFCSCTSTRLIPSVACYLSGELGLLQTHASVDLVAACAGLPYGLAEAVRLLQEVDRPVLLVCAEKFSDKIGSVRTSRMIFGDGAAAMVIAPGAETDVEILQTYASGPVNEVNSIIWPNPVFDNNITVYGPDVKSLVERYLHQMIGELGALPGPGGTATMLEAIDLIVPHQANKVMVSKLALEAGIPLEHVYFNIEKVGNVSAASIPLAIHDAVAEGVIDRPMLVFAPGFGAGAVGGYAVIRIDPAVVAISDGHDRPLETAGTRGSARGGSVEDMRVGFGE
jgi:3-oxoacyl-[acyl-carrier-protein] synthase-3